MSRRPSRMTAVLTAVTLPVGVALLLCGGLALAQSTLGELLDVGAKPLSPAEFKEEVVQRVIIGSTPRGGTIEVIYTAGGYIQGTGSPSQAVVKLVVPAPLTGQWTLEDDGRVCTSMQIMAMQSPPVPGTNLPPRCQFWFKYNQQYFLADSDSDRSARVIRRTLKP
jgi:hypothetical protein